MMTILLESGKGLADQARMIFSRSWFTDLELQEHMDRYIGKNMPQREPPLLIQTQNIKSQNSTEASTSKHKRTRKYGINKKNTMSEDYISIPSH